MADVSVYIISAEGRERPVKVGISDNPWRRAERLQTGSPHRLVVREVYTEASRVEAALLEREFHIAHAGSRLSGEWFDIEFAQANAWLFSRTMRGYFDAA